MAEEIIKVIDALCDKFGIAADWTAENLLPYAQQLCHRIVVYKMTTSIVWIVLSAVAIAASLYLATKKFYPTYVKCFNARACTSDQGDGWYILALVFYIVAVLSLVVLLVSMFTLIRCITLPDAIAFEYIKRLI